MNEGEYHFFHATQDMQDELNSRIRKYQDEFIAEYWADEGMVLEALKEAVSEDETYAMLLCEWHRTQNYSDIGRLTLHIIERYFELTAREAAEDKASWD